MTSPQILIISGGAIFHSDGTLKPATVLVRDGRIDAVEESLTAPEGARVIDAAGCTVLPGLIDIHNHITSPAYDETKGESDDKKAFRVAQNAMSFLRAGITTIRDVGGYKFMSVALRDSIEDGLVPGPRIRCAGLALCITGGHSYSLAREADGVDEVRKAAREQLRAGADFIKLMCSGGVARVRESADAVQFTFEEIRAAVEEAQTAGSYVAAHCHPARAIKQAVKAGAQSIEHGSFIDEEAADMMLEHNVFLVPTFSIYAAITRKPELAELHERASSVLESKKKTFELVLKKGVRWAVGTDSGSWAPVDSMVDEMVTLHQLGVSTTDVLLAATRGNAELMDLPDTGSIIPGKRADIIIVEGDPIHDLHSLRNVSATVANGVVYEWSSR